MEILVVALSIFSVSFFIAYIHAALNLKKTTSMLTELLLIHVSMKGSLDDLPNNVPSPEDLHKENFIKFLSDSRDWAYTYIEDVQKGLNDFIKNVEPSIDHFNKFGIVVEGSPHHKSMKIISENFKNLKKLLPEETDDRR